MVGKCSNLALFVTAVLLLFSTTASYLIFPPSSFNNSERHALIQSGWWSHDSSNISNHCNWTGIKCDNTGSVAEIDGWDLNINSKSLQLQSLNLTAFPNLVSLYLFAMGLTGRIPKEIGTLTKLAVLALSNNNLHGKLPPSLSNLTQVEVLDVTGNSLSGIIPSNFGQLENLNFLGLASNQIEGPIPLQIRNFSHLELLSLSSNSLNGSIPSPLGQLQNLTYLGFASNQISGPIPLELGNLKWLKVLYLSNNLLTGTIPSSFGQLRNLTLLHLESNQVRGSIPFQLGNLNMLEELYLSNNSLTGTIPSTLGQLESLIHLYLDSNQIEGHIPVEIGNLEQLEILNLSSNSLSGTIPLEVTSSINLSFNFFECPQGFDDESLIGNTPKCSNVCCFFQKTKRPNNLIVIALPITCCLLLFIFVGILCYIQRTEKVKFEQCSEKNGDLFSIWNYDGKIAFEDIIQATHDFDIRYCIGTGGYGSVYRAQLPSGKIVALKKLHQRESQNPSFDRSFRNEVKMLSQIRHRNIVKLHGFCLHNRCMFLVYEYMERGSLFYALSIDDEAN